MRAGIVSLVLLSLAVLTLAGAETAWAAQNFGTPTPGQHVYDRAGVLTAQQLTELEQHVARVEATGTPTIVYIQQKSASNQQTQADAAALMEAWNVESRPNAHDGLVVFLNLKPNDPKHGEVALFAGAALYQDGPLSQAALQRIIDDAMLPRLKQGNIAGGIADGLDAAAQQITNPTPVGVRSPRMETLAGWVRLPLNVLALAVALLVAWIAWRIARSRPRTSQPVVATITPPSGTPPATVGALVQGRVADSELAGAILELGRRGGLSVEPESKSKVRIKLGKRAAARTEVEAQLWDKLARLAGPDGVVEPKELSSLPREWRWIKETLHDQLVDAGLYATDAAARRRPGYIAGAAALAGATVLGILAIASSEPWGMLGVAALVVAGFGTILAVHGYPETTEAGETEAAAWRGYLAGLKDLGKRSPASLQADIDLDVALPYLLAMGSAGILNKRLEEASKAGFSPAWLSQSLRPDQHYDGFYPAWIAFTSSMAPTSSGTGFSAGGAAAGGGGAGGSF